MFNFDAETEAEDVATTLSEYIKGKNVIITGVSQGGIGFEVARVISKYANLVIMAGRTKEKLEASVEAIKKESPQAILRMLTLDLSSLASTRAAAAEVNTYTEPIHVLINNAASKAAPFYKIDGVESQFFSNHLAPFVFTNLILPRLRAATPEFSPRIVNITSRVHVRCDFRFDDYNFEKGGDYDILLGYAHSKAANVLFTQGLAKRLGPENVLTFSVNPGTIWTPLLTGFSEANREDAIKAGLYEADGVTQGSTIKWKTVGAGAATHVFAAFDPSLDNQSGAYLKDAQVHNEERSSHASDPKNAEKLWSLSEKLAGETF